MLEEVLGTLMLIDDGNIDTIIKWYEPLRLYEEADIICATYNSIKLKKNELMIGLAKKEKTEENAMVDINLLVTLSQIGFGHIVKNNVSLLRTMDTVDETTVNKARKIYKELKSIKKKYCMEDKEENS